MYNYGQYYPQYIPQMQRLQNLEQQYPQFAQQPQQSYPQNPQSYPQPSLGLQGKLVDSIEVVKAIDIPLDGSTSYFALTDGSAIVTKQLQSDGTSKTIIYKPFTEPTTPLESIKYVSEEEVKAMLENSSETILELQDDIKELKRQNRDILEDIKELRKTKETKRKSDE